MIRFLAILAVLFFSFRSSAQERYAVSAIPKSLINRASAVVRDLDYEVIMNKPDDLIYKVRSAVTVMNSAGDDEGEVVIFYDKIFQVKSVRGIIYNEFGLPVSKFTEKDLKDVSAVSSVSLYEDDRVKYFRPAMTSYPYTIVYESEIRSRQSLFLPTWRPVPSEGVAIEKSTFRFTGPADYKLRYKEYNYPGKVVENTEKNIKTYKWQLSDLPATRFEPYSPDPDRYRTRVRLAPETFAYRGITGKFSNWTEFGTWMNENLLKGRDVLSPLTKQYINELVKDTEDPKAKAKMIYEYMQNKCRYISVQIGIGGHQPYPAMDVDRLGYGDCKGLVNYTKALLKAAGIESYYCIVNSGTFKKDVSADFASLNDGDHVILCLPFKNDTTWLECTSKHYPFGFLGDFTDDRLVLACTPEGGKLLKTPRFAALENRQSRKASFKLAEDGDLSGKIQTRFEGTQYDNHDMLEGEPFKEQVKELVKLYPLPNLEIGAFEFKKEKSLKPVTIENIDFQSRAYGALSGGIMYISLNPVNKEKRVMPDLRVRNNPLFINRGYIDEDEYTFELPAKAKIEYRSGNTTMEKPFGKYTATVNVKDNIVTYRRVLQMNEGTYPKEQYAEFVKFYQDIVQADNDRLILKF